jgi:class 3 adenylate cyclase/CHASE2 domain-containing sensor protein
LLWVFCFSIGHVNPKKLQLIPTLIAVVVIGLVCLLEYVPQRFQKFEFFQGLEWMTYDWRMRSAFEANSHSITPHRLGVVYIDEETVRGINDNEKYRFRYPYPKQLYGKVVSELNQQGAKLVGFDILFDQVDAPNPATAVKMADGSTMGSDEYFAEVVRDTGKVVLGVMGTTENDKWRAIPPHDLFRTNSYSIAHVTSDSDYGGVLRRAIPFQDDDKIGRVWHLGIVLAAEELHADLPNTTVEDDKIILHDFDGKPLRVIPTEKDHTFYINWSLSWNDQRITKESFVQLLKREEDRREGKEDSTQFRDCLVVIGSTAAGNNWTDMGATPLDKQTYLVSKHWNVAHSILQGEFVQRSPLWLNLLLIITLGALAAILTWEQRVITASLLTVLSICAYIFFAHWMFVQSRYWLPIILPVGGALFMTHIALVTHRVVFEQNERRRVRGVFSKLVSPNIVNQLLEQEKISLGGARREITVYFADVRGFTDFTNAMQAKAEEHVRKSNLSPEETEKYFDRMANESLVTVNLYLATIADTIKKHDGTLDKFMGDCVMAFWGAPLPNPKHAMACVHTAIESQRAMHQLNQDRFVENKRREEENKARAEKGEAPLDMLPLLSLGSGINSGLAIVGMMGSEDHIFNYTVFGREVNLASRLEGVSGRGRIIISASTYRDLLRDDPALAASCVKLQATQVKGFKDAIEIYEVPWKTPEPQAETAIATGVSNEAVKA